MKIWNNQIKVWSNLLSVFLCMITALSTMGDGEKVNAAPPAAQPPITAARTPWKNPLVKQGYLDSPLVEVTPLVFKGELYLMECWRSNWKWDGAPDLSEQRQSAIWLTHLPDGPTHYGARVYLSRALDQCTLGTAIVWDDRVYVYGAEAASSTGGQVVYMTWTQDMKSWSEPVKVFESPAGRIFNVAVTRDQLGMVFLWETDGYGQPFTMCYGRVKEPTAPWNPGIIPDARYGMDKYTGGPALYYENGWYYTLYLEALGGGRYETRVTRSTNLMNWQDAAAGRPFVTFNQDKGNIPLCPPSAREHNASDAELCYFKGQTIVYYTGSDQSYAGDLQWATYDGKPADLLESFFAEEAETDLAAPAHLGDWAPVLIASENAPDPKAQAPVAALRKYRPSPAQQAYQEGQLGAFIHFGPATYINSDMHATPKPDLFNPVGLDAEQWAKAAKSFGAKHVVLTAKHHNGFCLWPTKTTTYSVASSPWRNGKGDVVRDFVDACRKQGLRPGLYISGGDAYFKCSSTPEPMGERHIVGDRKAYFEIYKQQMEEILTRYGPLAIIWFDGAYDPFGWDIMDAEQRRLGSECGDAIAAMIREHQPDAVIFQGTQPDVRWSGSEQGWAPYPLWNVIPEGQGTQHWLGPDNFGYILPEACMHTRSTWFWSPDSDASLQPVQGLVGAYDTSIGRGANLLINMTPDTSGLIPDIEVQRLADFGKELLRQFDTPAAQTCSSNGWTSTGVLVLNLASIQSIDRLVIEEDLKQGQRVVSYAVDAWSDTQWQPVAEGLSIGRKRIHRFDPLKTDRIRLRITGAVDVPNIRSFAVYAVQ